MTLPLNKKTAKSGWSLGVAPCLLALAMAAPADAARVTTTSNIAGMGGASVTGPAPGELNFRFGLVDLSTPVTFEVDLAPNEVITNLNIGIVPPPPTNGSFRFFPSNGISFTFGKDAVLTGSTPANWSSMVSGARLTDVDPVLDTANFAADDVHFVFTDQGLGTGEIEITTLNATGFSISGADFLFTVDVAEVPLPAAVWLFASGLVGAAAVGRRKKKATA